MWLGFFGLLLINICLSHFSSKKFHAHMQMRKLASTCDIVAASVGSIGNCTSAIIVISVWAHPVLCGLVNK